MIKFDIGASGLLEPRFKPLICVVLYGANTHFDCLRLLLESLVEFGQYDGDIAIFSDRLKVAVLPYIPDELRSRARFFSLDEKSLVARYTIANFDLQDYAPILYLDNDIVVDNNIMSVLVKVALTNKVCVMTEAQTYPELSGSKISDIKDVRRIGNWFGLELLRSDPECGELFLPVANSGIVGFRDHETFRLVGNLTRELFHHPAHATLAKYFTDQPFFNYVLVKTATGAWDFLSDTCQLVGWTFPIERRGFVHFVWARGEDKVRQMEAYLRHLRAGVVVQEIPTGNAIA